MIVHLLSALTLQARKISLNVLKLWLMKNFFLVWRNNIHIIYILNKLYLEIIAGFKLFTISSNSLLFCRPSMKVYSTHGWFDWSDSLALQYMADCSLWRTKPRARILVSISVVNTTMNTISSSSCKRTGRLQFWQMHSFSRNSLWDSADSH